MDQDSGAPPPEEQDPAKKVREPTEGVRIIGAEEAAEAVGRPDVVARIPDDAPRFGDRAPSEDTAPPPVRLPAAETGDPNSFGAVPIVAADDPPPTFRSSAPSVPSLAADEEDLGRMLGGRRAKRDDTASRPSRRSRRRSRRGEDEVTDEGFESDEPPVGQPSPDDAGSSSSTEAELPHWTRPATGEVPKVLAPEGEEGDLDAWAGLSSQPVWRDDPGRDEADDFSDLTGETRIIPAPGEAVAPPVQAYDDFGAIPPPPQRPEPREVPPLDPVAHDSVYDVEPSATERSPYPESRRGDHPLVPDDLGHGDNGGGAGRDLPLAVGVGVGLFVGYLILNKIGTAAVTALVLVVIVMAVVEFFNAVRRVGYQPAVLPGLVGTGMMVLGVHWKGEAAFPLVTLLVLVVLMLWYVIGLQHERAVANIAITFFGVMWIGGLGSFAALMLSLPNGEGLLGAAVITTIAYDVGAFAVGRQMGKTPLSPSSPNKTVEGLVGGGLAAVVVSVVVLGVVGVFPWELSDAFLLGLAVAVVAPLGDLCESMLKRDLGLKDMGSILPGHGGLLDRFDALLFVLPVTYYVVRVLDVLAN